MSDSPARTCQVETRERTKLEIAAAPGPLVIANGGRLYGIELKVRGGQLSRTKIVRTKRGAPRELVGQVERFAELEAAGVEIAVCRTVHAVLDQLELWRIHSAGESQREKLHEETVDGKNIKPRLYDLVPSEFLAAVAGELTVVALGVYWMICLLQYERRGPIPNDMVWLRRKFKPSHGLSIVDGTVHSLVATGANRNRRTKPLGAKGRRGVATSKPASATGSEPLPLLTVLTPATNSQPSKSSTSAPPWSATNSSAGPEMKSLPWTRS
jgi:hypothetical protein